MNHTAFSWPDPLAAAVAVLPSVVTAEENRFVDVEVGQGLARGQTIVDYRPQSPMVPNAHIIRQIDMPAFQELLRSAVEQAREQH
jgi:inosine-uridine nucleoside N-ribohydrolase